MTLNLRSLLLVGSLALFLAIHPSSAHSRKLKSPEKASFGSPDEVKRYFERFGYKERVEQPDAAAGDAVNELSLEAAIRLYQEKNHLKVTGKLDSETVAIMKTPRCGMPDIVREPAKGGHHNSKQAGKFHAVVHYNFFESMYPWTQRELKYTFTSTIPSVSSEDLRAICARAFQRWAAVSPFQFREAEEGEQADIRIGFYVGDHGDNNPFDGPRGVWAHAFAPRDGRLHFDGSEQWSTATPTMYQTDLESVALHEIGHTLGLGHSSDVDAVMYAYINQGDVKRELQQDDINGIQALYPSK